MRAHQPLDAVAADLDAVARERLPRAPAAVAGVIRGVHRLDAPEQPLVADGPRRSLAGRAVVVGGRRHAQDPADRLDAEATAVLIDKAAHFGRSASSSAAKNTDAALRISFARLSSETCLRNALISARSSLVGKSGRRPSSASTWRTCLRNVSGGTPRSRATCAIGRPLSNTSRAPRSSSSGGYFPGRDISRSSTSSRTEDPGIEVSVKPQPGSHRFCAPQCGGYSGQPLTWPAPPAAG